MDEKIFSEIISLVTRQTGIIPRESHKTGIKNFIDKRCRELDLPERRDYYVRLPESKEEFSTFINNSTVNETYFFREEAQFALLKEKIFPKLASQNPGERVRIWSAAASSGEEIYSLYLLATSMRMKTKCIASDINSIVLDKCAKGEYGANSLRKEDGTKFHHLLIPYQDSEKKVKFPKEITESIERQQINLSKKESIFPKNISLVFLRNVFIYFTLEMRREILDRIVNTSLAPGGYIFVSVNETAMLDKSILPPNLEKVSDGNVFYLQKKA